MLMPAHVYECVGIAEVVKKGIAATPPLVCAGYEASHVLQCV
jgi:hypothetical protein